MMCFEGKSQKTVTEKCGCTRGEEERHLMINSLKKVFLELSLSKAAILSSRLFLSTLHFSYLIETPPGKGKTGGQL